MHKSLVKTNLHEVSLPEFHNLFATYDVFLGQRICMKCLKRAKDNAAASVDTVENDIEMEKEENGEISVEIAHEIVDKSLELFDCSPLKNVKSDRTLQTGKRKITKMTDVFSKAAAIALDEPTLVHSSDCSNCSSLIELIKEKLAVTDDRREIIQLLTIVPCDLSISKIAEIFNVSEYTAKPSCDLRLQKGILSMLETKQRVGISQETKESVLEFYESEEISRLLSGKKDVVSVRLPDKTRIKKQKGLLLCNISEIYEQFKKENPNKKIGFSKFALLCPKWCIPLGAAGTQCLCLRVSPKCKTNAGSHEFLSKLQTNHRDVCM